MNMLSGDVKPKDLSFCDVCAEAKQCRDPFKNTRPRATRVLERIHSDVCGQLLLSLGMGAITLYPL